MANDITTLAIALQSREAETNLKTFNELLTAGSKNAKAMENMKIGVDVNAALKELEAFKASYEDIAKTAQNIHFDLGVNMPTAAPPVSAVDTSALEELKTFFQEAAEEMRKQAEMVSDGMEKMGAGAERAGGNVRSAGESMRGAGAAASDYAKKIRELNAAKKDLAKAEAKADADAIAANEAYRKAKEARIQLEKAEQRLADDRERMKFAPDLVNKNLIAKVKELSDAYAKAQAEADKFGKKLYTSSLFVDEARAKYEQLKAELAGIPVPVRKAGKSVDTFALNAKHAGTTVTKLARGFNAVAFAGGAAVPGLAKAGMAISMFAYSGPYVGAAIVGIGLLAAHIKKLKEQSAIEAQIISENAERAKRSVQSAKDFMDASESDWKRLGELSEAGINADAQNREAITIINRLAEAYGYLGIEIDKTTGKLNGYGIARDVANEYDRIRLRMQLQNAVNTTKTAYQNAISERNISDVIGPGTIDTIKGAVKLGLDATANRKAMQESELVTFMEELGSKSLEYQYDKILNRITSLSSQLARGAGIKLNGIEFTNEEANSELKYLQDVIDKLDAARKAKRTLEEFDTSPIEKYSKEVGKLAASLKEAESKFVSEDGALRLKTAEEVYQAQKARIAELNTEIEKNAKIYEMATLDNGKQAGIYLKELELERSNLLEKTLTYEQRISEEKKRQTKSLNDAINADQMRLNTLQASYKMNKNGEIVRAKNTDELAQDRTEEIRTLQAFIGNRGYGETLEDEKELVAARLKLAQLQAEQVKYSDQVAAAGKQNAAARKGYVFDEKTGAVLRKKTEDELQAERKKEIEAARARVRATEAGTLERAKAQAELDRLAIEEYNDRKKMTASVAFQDVRAENTRMVRGIEARSSEALALESRSFRRDDSEKTILKDTNKVQTDIKDFVKKIFDDVQNMSTTFNTISENIQPL